MNRAQGPKIATIVLFVVITGVAVWYFGVRSTPNSTNVISSSIATKTIHLTYPTTWKSVSATTVHGAPSNAIIVLQRTDKSGVLVVLPGGKAPPLNAISSNKISSELATSYKDYKFVNAAIINLKGKHALFITYLRTKQGDLHTVTILPVGQRSFDIETASPSANGQLGVEIGKILKSVTITSSP